MAAYMSNAPARKEYIVGWRRRRRDSRYLVLACVSLTQTIIHRCCLLVFSVGLPISADQICPVELYSRRRGRLISPLWRSPPARQSHLSLVSCISHRNCICRLARQHSKHTQLT